MPNDARAPLRNLIEKAKRATGLAPKELIGHAKPGAVYSIRDDIVVLPQERIDGSGVRTLHPTRRAIVVQCIPQVRATKPVTILVIPCSASSHGPVESYNFDIPSGEPGFDAERVVAYTSLIQPVLKADLVTYHGQITDETLRKIQAVIAINIGLIQETSVSLPERISNSMVEKLGTT